MLGSCWFCPGLPPPAFGMESTHLYLTQAWTCLWDTATPGQSCRYSWPAHSRACPGSYLLHVESQFRCSYASIGKSQFVKIHDRFFPSIWFNWGNFISLKKKNPPNVLYFFQGVWKMHIEYSTWTTLSLRKHLLTWGQRVNKKTISGKKLVSNKQSLHEKNGSQQSDEGRCLLRC